MGKLFLSIIILVLFQSCHTYKIVDTKAADLIVGEKYKIQRNYKIYKYTVKSLNDSVVTVKKANSEEQIPTNEIIVLGKRKFSIVKTIALIPVVGIAVAIIAWIADPNINIGSMDIKF
ncbi:hypothetical protein [Flavobacterium sp.]